MKNIFISYSHKDKKWKDRIVSQLGVLAQDGKLSMWDDKKIAAGADWLPEIEKAINSCDIALLLISADFLNSPFILGKEVPPLLERRVKDGVRVIPVILRSCAWDEVSWLSGIQARPDEGKPLSSMSREKADNALTALVKEIHNPNRATSHPAISTGLEKETKTTAISRLRCGGDLLLGRETELALLDKVWNDPATHIVTLIAWGGVGKTELVTHWQAGLAARNYDGASYFDWSFYSQGTKDTGAASADTFVKAALLFFGDEEMANSPAGAWDKGARIAELVAVHRTLLILDGMEPLQYPPGPMAGELKDPAVKALLTGLAQKNSGLCVVTTRERVTDLDSYSHSTVQQVELQHLSVQAGVALLKQLGVKGAEKEFTEVVEKVGGHALTLNLLGRYLFKAHKCDIRKHGEIKFDKADEKIQGGHAFRMLAAYEKWLAGGDGDAKRGLAILRLLGLFERPADAGCLGALRQKPKIKGLTEALADIGDEEWNFALTCLEECRLVALKDGGGIDAHPLLREYFAKKLQEGNKTAWREGNRRLYEYLTTSTIDKEAPTLEELQPLYQAVVHGVRAGLVEEARSKVYRDRINKGTGSGGFYVTKKLGAFGADLGAVACFFEEPWNKFSSALSEGDQAWLLNAAAFRLRALGRLNEAVEPMRAGVEGALRLKDWENAARYSSNLSELELTLGLVKSAVEDGRQSVEFADRSGDEFLKMGIRATHADALHQYGKRDEAHELFQEAEKMQAKLQPGYPLLYSFSGFKFCDLLLSDIERRAWQRWKAQYQGHVDDGLKDTKNETTVCREVEERGKKMFDWRLPGDPLLDIALDHLTLGRTNLYLAILGPADTSHRQSAVDYTKAAVDGLRAAGRQDHLPRGLLTRAWVRHALQNDPAGSAFDLNEAQQIAERGSMQLHLADVHLTRGRLFNDKAEIAKARKIIVECEYWRRKEELEDAEEWMR